MAASPLDLEAVQPLVDLALREDLGDPPKDWTSDTLFPSGASGRARLIARSALVVAGLPVAGRVFATLNPGIEFEPCLPEGGRAGGGTVLARVAGPLRDLLRGERTALNFLGRLCGIASASAEAVSRVRGTGVRILDTRKTAPGHRILDKYAVRVGGGTNHRMGLYDAAMIKDTHRARLGLSITEAVARLLRAGLPPERITVEVRGLDELDEAVASGAGRVLLDNFDLRDLRRAVERAGGRVELEASGGIRMEDLPAVAATGVDTISLGWLTHSAPAADVAMELEP